MGSHLLYEVTAEGSTKGVMRRRIIPTMDVDDELSSEAELGRRSKGWIWRTREVLSVLQGELGMVKSQRTTRDVCVK